MSIPYDKPTFQTAGPPALDVPLLQALVDTVKAVAQGGAGSGLDADTLDGQHASAFATASQGAKADAALPSSSYTAADVKAKLLTVDGSGSTLDADLLDGQHASAFATAAQGAKADAALPSANYTAADVLAKLLTVDGAGTGLDADTLDGNHASAFATAAQGAKADAAQPSASAINTGNIGSQSVNYAAKAGDGAASSNIRIPLVQPTSLANGDIWLV